MTRWIAALVVLAGLLITALVVMPYLAQTADPPAPPARQVPFDAKRAMSYLVELCKIGPRISGTEGMKQQALLKKHFESLGGKVEEQVFEARQNSRPEQAVTMTNLIVKWHPERARRVILCSHYDTRPLADQEEDVRKWTQPFLSANDGGSGVAWLMELAHHMKDLPTNVGVDFVIFDGEEYVFEANDKYFFGSSHFAKAYKQGQPKHTYVAAVLLDMIAGKDPHFKVEQISFRTRWLVEDIWRIGLEQKCSAFLNQLGEVVQDDHLALIRDGGIPAIDIIDMSYPHWHRLSDVPENCFPEGLEQVAGVLTIWLQHVK